MIYNVLQQHSVLVLLLSLILSANLKGQKGIEAGALLGVSNYFGDLNTHLDITRPGLTLGVFAKRNFNERVSIRGGFHFSRVSGDDQGSPNNFERTRNLSFRSNIIQASGVAEFNFFPHEHGSSEYGNTPYLLAGIGVLGYTPSAVLDGTRYNLRPLGTEGQNASRPYNLVTGAWILGAGWKLDLGPAYTVAVEFQYNRLWTDYVDDVSTVYPEQSSLPSQLAASLSDRSLDPDLVFPGRQRGDRTGQDVYTVINISLARYWGRLECPRISHW